MKIKISALCMAILMLTSFSMTGCGKKNKDDNGSDNVGAEIVIDTATKEIRQNDYRGGAVRTKALQDGVLKVMEDMKQNNTVIRQDSPNSFWTAEGYQDFVVNFLNSVILDDTQWLNEEETDWENAVKRTSTVKNSFTQPNSDSPTGYSIKSGITIKRNEKDDYTISGFTVTALTGTNLDNAKEDKKYSGTANYRILYDCDKDWCKAYSTLSFNNDMPSATADLFEYARIDNDTFAVQTQRERLLVILNHVEQDTDMRERTVKEFYYSKLTAEGVRTTFTPFKPLPEYDEDTMGHLPENKRINERYKEYAYVNDKGDLTTMYGVNDSMFLTDDIMKNVNAEWVYADKSLQQAITYKDGALVVTTYNKLSKSYERFIYARNGVTDEEITEIENMVEIDNLVGIQEIPEMEIPEIPETTTVSTTESMTDTTSEETMTTEAVTETDSQTATAAEQTESPEDEQRRIAGERLNGDVFYE